MIARIPAYRLHCLLRLRQAGQCFAAFPHRLVPCGESWRELVITTWRAVA